MKLNELSPPKGRARKLNGLAEDRAQGTARPQAGEAKAKRPALAAT